MLSSCCAPPYPLLPSTLLVKLVLATQREKRQKERGKGDAVMGTGVWSEIRQQQAGGLQKGVVYLTNSTLVYEPNAEGGG